MQKDDSGGLYGLPALRYFAQDKMQILLKGISLGLEGVSVLWGEGVKAIVIGFGNILQKQVYVNKRPW